MSSLTKFDSRTPDKVRNEKVGNGLAVTAVGGGALYLAAGLLPYVTFPMLLVAAVVAAIYFRVKS